MDGPTIGKNQDVHVPDAEAEPATLTATAFDADSWRGFAYAGLYAQEGREIKGWSDHNALCRASINMTFAKGGGPGVMYATTSNGRRRNVDMAQNAFSCGLAIDLDTGVLDLAPIEAVLSRLESKGITYHYQWRGLTTDDEGNPTYKIHIAIPYAQGYPVNDVGAVRRFQAQLTELILGDDVDYDRSTTKVAGLLFLMTNRPSYAEKDRPQQRFYNGPNAIDMQAMFPVAMQGIKMVRDSHTIVRPEAEVLQTLVHVRQWNSAKNAWEIDCPVGHEDDYDSKTYLYKSGHISCMAGKCQGKPLAWFLDHMSDEAQLAVAQNALAIAIESNLTKVSVAEAHKVMAEALDANRAIENNATVIRISPGAGKTRAIAQKLNVYSAPFEDEDANSGLSSVLAVPTNALLREVETRLEVPHQRKFGVLAVLNDDGSPACKKHGIASALQKSGGNVHKLLCGHCEYKEDCPARQNATTGVGSLVLTNHALMSNVSKDMHRKARHPLLIWDESPQWTASSQIDLKDLTWLIEEFDREAQPVFGLDAMLAAMTDVRLFSAKYRVAVRPVIEAVRWICQTYRIGTISTKRAVSVWAQIPSHRMMLDRALKMLGLSPAKTAWEDMVASFSGAFRLNTTEMGFDGMRKDTQKRVLRAEGLVASLGMITGEDAVMVLAKDFLMLASLTPSGELFRRNGGVVLDATANLAELRALRPDVKVVSLQVEDQGATERYMHFASGLDRKSLAHRPERFASALNHARSAVRRWSDAQAIAKVKVVVFTYRAQVAQVQAQWPEAEVGYFGNTRGYDRFFQEGFDAFVTIGDPISNLTSLALQWRVLTGKNPTQGDPAWTAYVSASAESELAQAHGRARNPQAKLGRGGRLHLHYGRRAPLGWGVNDFKLDPLSFKDRP